MPIPSEKEASHLQQKPVYELLSHSLVDIYVGPQNTSFTLHEKLLCHYSPFFTSHFYTSANRSSTKTPSYGLPDEEEEPFILLVGWLYSQSLPQPNEEGDVGKLLDVYLLADKFEMTLLADEVVEVVRAFYHSQNSYPGLRRVQYIYANTSEDNRMREMMVSSIARFLTLSEAIPAHWERALRKNAQLAVDIIRAIQEWHLESRTVPDPRDGSIGFASIHEDEEGSSFVSVSGAESLGEKVESDGGVTPMVNGD
ncbi:MAG: hypothetical protein M1834_001716 [Cirrosporium novae-zelandiae]|nr:MAG: hypothetical protein M1834_001716 [Cirrosporium novae-zelandiae]